ncbi:MAG TPA: radical SAM protein [Desulfobacteraceae bacterium]|nr:radical SAM protein [Desulfobacteraceae bacterium]|tara:strand:+ start:603 stop:1877 length:1275 start_codon:yes stop_codon:yes gene_type:complete
MYTPHRIPPAISLNRKGTGKITRNPFLKQFGRHARIKTRDHEFIFTPQGEIRFIRGLGTDWPHPSEQLKRTDGNDWIHYSVGDDSTDQGIISWMGEYYLPCLPYPSNSVWNLNYRENPGIMTAFGAWSQLFANLWDMNRKITLRPEVLDLVQKILANDDQALFDRTAKLKRIIGTQISVLPPDTRHVDYDIIPLIVADGCRYRCRFCCVKSSQKFRTRSANRITTQIRELKDFYGQNLKNYNAVFLGNHDALAAGSGPVLETAEKAYEAFEFDDGRKAAPRFFLFGSAGSLLDMDPSFFDRLDTLPFDTWINIGLESCHDGTLKTIGKPLTEKIVRAAFHRICDLNQKLSRVEITCNFLIGTDLAPPHYDTMIRLLTGVPASGKGCVYLSPIKDSPKKRELLPQFREIREASRLPVFIYLIQRF